MSLMEKEDIKKYIPHRDPFLMVDTIEELSAGQHVKATKKVQLDEPHFAGHFPGNPVMPGVLIVEAMAQAAGVMMFKHLGFSAEDADVYFMKLDKVRFKKLVVPPTTLTLSVEKTKEKAGVCAFTGQALNPAGEVVAEADFMAKVMPKAK